MRQRPCPIWAGRLAKDFLKKVVDAKLDEQQLLELSEECGSTLFIELAGRRQLLPKAETLADAVLAAVRSRQEDSQRIAELIGQLQDASPKKRTQAAIGLQAAGRAAIGPLIGVLADPAANRRARQRAGRAGRDGSSGAPSLDGSCRRRGPGPGRGGDRRAGGNGRSEGRPLSDGAYASPHSPPQVKAAAAAAIRRLDGGLPTASQAARRLLDAARVIF